MHNHESFIPMLERHTAFSVHLRFMRWFIVALMFWDVQSAVAQQSVAPYSLEWEVVSTEGIPGMTTARLYAKLVNPTDYLTSVSGWDQMDGRIETTTSFYQDPDGWVTPNNNNPLLFDLLPTLRYDSWVTIGIDVAPSGIDGEIPIGVFPPESGYWVSDFEEGNDLVMDVDGAWFVTLGSTNGTAGEDLRVLVGQFTTDGTFQAQVHLQVLFDEAESPTSLLLSYDAPSCGCTDSEACNYVDAAEVSDGSCVYALEGFDCSGACVGANNNGVCDNEEVFGCTNPVATNFDPGANVDDGNCLIEGCTYTTAINYQPQATMDDQSCLFESGEEGDCPDLDGDASVATSDLLIFLAAFGLICGQ